MSKREGINYLNQLIIKADSKLILFLFLVQEYSSILTVIFFLNYNGSNKGTYSAYFAL